MVIRLIVYANSKEEALERAKEILENGLVGENGEPFDFYTTFDIPKKLAPMSGRARWGNFPPAVKLMSKKGIELLNKGWEFTVKDFKYHLQNLVKIGEKHNWNYEKLMNDGNFRFHAYSIGEYSGSNIWLYDDDGEGIRDLNHLKNAIEKWKVLYEDRGKENPHEDYEVWIVPVDVHF